jgi:chemotaxis protein histidine kinase CheA
MADKKPIELFMPPNMLKAKVGAGTPGLDLEAIKRAETAVGELKSQFAGWAAIDVEKLMTAKAAFGKTPDAATRAALMRAAFDLKGQAATYEFPTVARVAGSLAKLLGELPDERALPAGLVDAHVGAVHVIFRDKVRDTSNKVVQTLSAELEKQVGVALL